MRNLRKRSLTSVALSALLIGAISCGDSGTSASNNAAGGSSNGGGTSVAPTAQTHRYSFKDLDGVAVDGSNRDTLRISGAYANEDISGIENFAVINVATKLANNADFGNLQPSNPILNFFDLSGFGSNTLTLPASMVPNVSKQVSGSTVITAGTLTTVSTNGGTHSGTPIIVYSNSLTATQQKLGLDGFKVGTGLTFTDAKLADLTLLVSGDNDLKALAAAGLKTLNLSTVKDSKFSVVPAAGTVLSKLTVTGEGTVNVDLANATIDSKFMVTGNDKVDLKVAAGGLANAVGANFTGINKLITNQAAVLNSAQATVVQAMAPKVLSFGATGSGVDASLVPSVKQFSVELGNMAETFTKVATGSTFLVDNSAGNSGTISITGNTGVLDAKVVLSGLANTPKVLTALTFLSPTLNPTIQSTVGPNYVTELTVPANGVLKITGDQDFAIASYSDPDYTLAGLTGNAVLMVDASALTGWFGMVADAKSPIIKVGSGGSMITAAGTAVASAITFGAGVDVLDLSTDTFEADSEQANVFLRVSNFGAKDVIVCSDAPTTVAATVGGSATGAGVITAPTTAVASGTVGYFTGNGNTYVVFGNGDNGFYVLELTGFTGTLTADNFAIFNP